MTPVSKNTWRPADSGQPLLSAVVAKDLVARASTQIELARSEARLHAAESGLELARRYTRAIDETVLFLWASVAKHAATARNPFDRIALVAQGGYGRAELNLYSDIDLLAILPADLQADEERAIRQLFHLLWDLHLDLGHSTKTIAECLDTLGTDIDSATALIESRFLTGNQSVYDTMREKFEQRLRRNQQRWFLEFRRRDWDERHEHYGASVYLLEPNVKQGEGGLRDVHTLRWLEFLFYGTTTLEGLESNGLISGEERQALLRGMDFILRVRNQLHLLEGRKCDLLSFDKQPKIAAALGYKAEGDLLPEEVFMRDYYVAAREVFRIADRVVGQLTEPKRRGSFFQRERALDDHLRRIQNEIDIAGDVQAYFAADPSRLIGVFAVAQANECRLSDAAKRHIEQAIARGLGQGLPDLPQAREAFFRILRAPSGVAAALREMHESGVLGAFLPEFRRIFCMVRADSYHKYTVDEHLLRAVEVAERLRGGDPAAPEILRRDAQRVRHWDVLYLAILLHDIGKGEGHGHVLRGGQIAQRIAARLNLPPDAAHEVRQLILDHLKLIHVALRRDLEDPKLIERVARDIGDPDHLLHLYILTYCDLRAVSPDSWSEWKSALLTELYDKTAAVLGGRPPSGRGTVESHDQLLSAVRSHLTLPEEEHSIPLSDYLAELPERYVATTPPAQIAHHYEMFEALDDENRVVWELRHPPGVNYSEITVVAYDRPGVFSVLCGAFASKRINILGAQVFSTRGGGVIDRFQVQDSRGQALPEGFVLERLRNDVNRIFCGRKTVEELFTRPVRESAPPAREELQRIAPPSVLVDNDGSDRSTIIEVKGYDRIGLLYDITRVFTKYHLDIELAMITTEAYRVVDVFYVTDADNNKIDDPAVIERLKTELLEVIA
ncbi:MAG: [protein-PII] uridylyltransferase [Candidatus Sumerlaeia bacterium]|nr:[protein-PII] uridylyltransferase [Candidatus Sumerlaeia bacterium]